MFYMITIIKITITQVCQNMLIIPGFKIFKQDACHEFDDSLCYKVDLVSKIKLKK